MALQPGDAVLLNCTVTQIHPTNAELDIVAIEVGATGDDNQAPCSRETAARIWAQYHPDGEVTIRLPDDTEHVIATNLVTLPAEAFFPGGRASPA